MSEDDLITCECCGGKTLPGAGAYAGMPVPKAPQTVTCAHCGAIYRLNKWGLSAERVDMTLRDTIMNALPLVVLTRGLALIVIIPFHYVMKALGRLLKPLLYRRVGGRWT